MNKTLVMSITGGAALLTAAGVATPFIINKIKTKGKDETTVDDPNAVVPKPTDGDGVDDPSSPTDGNGNGESEGADQVFVDVVASNSIAEAAKHVYGVVVSNSKTIDSVVTIKKSLLTSKGKPFDLTIPAGKSYSLVSDTEPFKIVFGEVTTTVKSNDVTMTL